MDKTFGIRYESGKFMIGDKVIKVQDDNIEMEGEMYMDTSGLWALITERNHKKYSTEDCDAIVITILGVVTLELTNGKNGLRYSEQFGKIFNGKESCPMLMMYIIASFTEKRTLFQRSSRR